MTILLGLFVGFSFCYRFMTNFFYNILNIFNKTLAFTELMLNLRQRISKAIN